MGSIASIFAVYIDHTKGPNAAQQQIRVYTLAALNVMLIALASCSNQAAINQLNAELRAKQTASRRLAADIARLDGLMQVRANRSPLANLALKLVEDAKKRDFKTDEAKGEALIGAGICLFNLEECNQFFADLQEFTTNRKRLEAEAQIINEELSQLSQELQRLQN